VSLENKSLITSIDKLDFNTTANLKVRGLSMKIKIWFIFLHLLWILYRQTLVLTWPMILGQH